MPDPGYQPVFYVICHGTSDAAYDILIWVNKNMYLDSLGSFAYDAL